MLGRKRFWVLVVARLILFINGCGGSVI
jgi:hypothetical protein